MCDAALPLPAHAGVAIPREFRKCFAGLQGIPLHFFGVVRKFNKKWGAERRVAIVTQDNFYLARTNGQIARCVSVHFITALWIDPPRHRIALKIPQQYDLCLQTERMAELESVLQLLCRGGQGGGIRTLTVQCGQKLGDSYFPLDLAKPPGYRLEVAFEDVTQQLQITDDSVRSEALSETMRGPPPLSLGQMVSTVREPTAASSGDGDAAELLLEVAPLHRRISRKHAGQRAEISGDPPLEVEMTMTESVDGDARPLLDRTPAAERPADVPPAASDPPDPHGGMDFPWPGSWTVDPQTSLLHPSAASPPSTLPVRSTQPADPAGRTSLLRDLSHSKPVSALPTTIRVVAPHRMPRPVTILLRPDPEAETGETLPSGLLSPPHNATVPSRSPSPECAWARTGAAATPPEQPTSPPSAAPPPELPAPGSSEEGAAAPASSSRRSAGPPDLSALASWRCAAPPDPPSRHSTALDLLSTSPQLAVTPTDPPALAPAPQASSAAAPPDLAAHASLPPAAAAPQDPAPPTSAPNPAAPASQRGGPAPTADPLPTTTPARPTTEPRPAPTPDPWPTASPAPAPSALLVPRQPTRQPSASSPAAAVALRRRVQWERMRATSAERHAAALLTELSPLPSGDGPALPSAVSFSGFGEASDSVFSAPPYGMRQQGALSPDSPPRSPPPRPDITDPSPQPSTGPSPLRALDRVIQRLQTMQDNSPLKRTPPAAPPRDTSGSALRPEAQTLGLARARADLAAARSALAAAAARDSAMTPGGAELRQSLSLGHRPTVSPRRRRWLYGPSPFPTDCTPPPSP
eukprot:TRINITY_DN43226_c0_g1_i1.p1 TRINITY_DN43226_c0_g1~~TRINITY_DN43226_c0_g1_i1.p1  ORF type:complete len:807 (+),score=153.38 TRINITY_DN43226_c0_g1_i1:55-2475(+)